MVNYEFFREVEKQEWKPQPIHFLMRSVLRMVIAFIALYIIVCGTILIAPVHADSYPQYEPQHEKLLSYVGLQIDDDSITCLLFVDSNGKLERFAWYDELYNYKTYIGSHIIWDYENDMIALYDREWNCVWSDWE